MRHTHRKVHVGRTFECIGTCSQVDVDGEVIIRLYPGEPATRNDPGTSADAEVCEFYARRITGYQNDHEAYDYHRHQRPDWFALLDQIMLARIEREWSVVERDYVNDAIEALEGDRD